MSGQSPMSRNLLSLAKIQIRFANEYIDELKTQEFKPRVKFLKDEITRLKQDAFENYKLSRKW
tara:strand:- start:620 stop:808 length:189 start_codon:yes stop_codon:yes gene_type:complete